MNSLVSYYAGTSGAADDHFVPSEGIWRRGDNLRKSEAGRDRPV